MCGFMEGKRVLHLLSEIIHMSVLLISNYYLMLILKIKTRERKYRAFLLSPRGFNTSNSDMYLSLFLTHDVVIDVLPSYTLTYLFVSLTSLFLRR